MPDDKEKSSTEKPVVKTALLKTIKLPTAVLGVDVSPDAKLLYAACLDGGVYEVDAESGSATLLGKHDSYASGVALLPRSSTLVSAGYDGVLQWHDTAERNTNRKTNAHRFWSWQMAASSDGQLVASVTGQYLCGSYKYEPAPETEPSVRIFNTGTGKLVRSFSHVPPVQAVAFSPDNRFLAAGNLMGEVRLWDLAAGEQLAKWSTSNLTSWGIIKSHCYIGGISAMAFAPDKDELLICGMGPMRDPMAGNGKQTWQRFAWRENPVKKIDEIHDGESGGGLPETLTFHPSKQFFVMAGRLAQGKWNIAFFDAQTGSLIHSLDAKNRITKAVFNADGSRLILGMAAAQQKKKDGKFPDFGQIAIYSLA
jgi:WD40 repeat protein